MFDFITAKDAAERWNISVSRVKQLCREGRIEGVFHVNTLWLIPQNTEKPLDGRKFRFNIDNNHVQAE